MGPARRGRSGSAARNFARRRGACHDGELFQVVQDRETELKRGIWSLLTLLSLAWASAFASSYDDMLQAIERDDTRSVAQLLKRGVDVDTVNPKGESLLMLAARSGKASVVKTILAAKPKINARNAYGETALMLAAINGRVDVVKLLLENGAEVNNSGWTPLMYAATNNHVEIARLLLARGAQVNATAQNGTSALMMAAREGHLPMVLLLLEHGADVNYTSAFG